MKYYFDWIERKNRVKNAICFILAASIFLLSGCSFASAPGSTGKSKPITNDLTEKGIELIRKVDQLAECEEYISLYTNDEEIISIIKGIAENDYATPRGIFVIEDLDALVFRNIMSETSLPDDISQLLKGKFASVLPSQITAMNGVNSLAATSILSYGESFIYEDLEKTVTYLYVYENENDLSFMVTYCGNDENIVNANVTIVINNKLSKCTSQEDVISFFVNTFNFQDVSVSAATK